MKERNEMKEIKEIKEEMIQLIIMMILILIFISYCKKIIKIIEKNQSHQITSYKNILDHLFFIPSSFLLLSFLLSFSFPFLILFLLSYSYSFYQLFFNNINEIVKGFFITIISLFLSSHHISYLLFQYQISSHFIQFLPLLTHLISLLIIHNKRITIQLFVGEILLSIIIWIIGKESGKRRKRIIQQNIPRPISKEKEYMKRIGRSLLMYIIEIIGMRTGKKNQILMIMTIIIMNGKETIEELMKEDYQWSWKSYVRGIEIGIYEIIIIVIQYLLGKKEIGYLQSIEINEKSFKEVIIEIVKNVIQGMIINGMISYMTSYYVVYQMTKKKTEEKEEKEHIN